MPKLILLALIVWAIVEVFKSAKKSAAEKDRAAEIARINRENELRKAEQQRMREEFRARQLEARLEVERMVAIEREQMRQAKELKAHEAWLVKHDEEIAKLTFRIEKAEKTIADHTDLLGSIVRRLDETEAELNAVSDSLFVMNYQLTHAENTPERKLRELAREAERTARQKRQLENQIVSLKKQKIASEDKIRNAQFDKAEAERKIA